jgi:hypothetical protein
MAAALVAISKSTFSLQPIAGGYELQIKFLDKSDGVVSTRKFSFAQPKPAQVSKDDSKVSLAQASMDELLDVYSQNGVCGEELLKNLFTKKDEQGVKKAAAVVKALAFKGPTMLVLDLKDPLTGYKPNALDTIAKAEKVVCDFFKSKGASNQASKHGNKIHSAVALDFVLCEGSLKQDLLKSGGFTASEVDYFHTAAGVQSLCQCAEFFMNAFKMGEQVQGGAFLAAKYIVPVSGKFAAFKPCIKSTVLYPALYKEIYSLQGAFAKVLSTVYALFGKYDAATKITTMSVVAKV